MADDAPDTPTSAPELVSAWMQAIDEASTEEKDWRAEADKTVKMFRGDGEGRSRFNIYHANIETIVPALYNSTPVPDIRTRFNDDDPVSKTAGDVLERAISFAVDAFDFDDLMLACTRDMAMVSRGLARARYAARFDPENGAVTHEAVTDEYVPWRSFRRSPGRVWSDVTWIAFEHFLSRDDVDRLIAESKVPLDVTQKVGFNFSASAKGDDSNNRTEVPRFSKRAHVWEVWNRDNRTVLFLAEGLSARPLLVQPDPLGLEQFFPVPRPMNALGSTDSLIPVTSLSVYESLVDDLNDVSRRIAKLVKQARPRGGYFATMGDLEKIANADDGELVPMQGMEQALSSGGDISKLIAWFPLDPTIKAIAELRNEREAIKQTIYEVTGISDIARGSSDPGETLGAQQLKTQWGSLRIQRMQSEVARFARDLFRLNAEVMSKHFSMDTFMMMTGLQLPLQRLRDAARQRVLAASQPALPQMGQPMPMPAPKPDPNDVDLAKQASQEEVEQVLKTDAMRGYRIDIESDSTIRGDLARNQQQQGLFLTGSGQFFQAMAPAVQSGAMPTDIVVEIYLAFARTFKLGKQAEDALAKWADEAREAKAAPQPEKPDPATVQANAKIAAVQANAQADQSKTQGQIAVEQTRGQVDQQNITLKAIADERAHQRGLEAADRDDRSLAFRAQFGPVQTADVGQQGVRPS